MTTRAPSSATSRTTASPSMSWSSEEGGRGEKRQRMEGEESDSGGGGQLLFGASFRCSLSFIRFHFFRTNGRESCFELVGTERGGHLLGRARREMRRKVMRMVTDCHVPELLCFAERLPPALRRAGPWVERVGFREGGGKKEVGGNHTLRASCPFLLLLLLIPTQIYSLRLPFFPRLSPLLVFI
eukprot:RCo046757